MEGMGATALGRSGRWVPTVAWGLAGVNAIALLVGAMVMATTGFEVVFYPGAAAGAVGLASVGALVVARRRNTLPGWLLLAFATGLTVTVTLRQVAWLVFVDLGGDLTLAQSLIVIADGAFSLWLPCLLLLFLTFPDGHLPSPRWRAAVAVLLGVTLTGAGVTMLAGRFVVDPAAYLTGTAMTNDAGVAPEAEPLLRLFDLLSGFLMVLFVLSIVSLVTRLRRADDDQRRRITWVVYAGLAWLVLIPISTLQRTPTPALRAAQDVIGGMAFVVLAAGFGIALFRHRLWDIDVVVRRSVVYGALWLAIAGMYAGVAAGLGLAAGARFPVELAILLTVVATLVFQPARRWLEQAADRWVFGRPGSPIEAVHGFSELIDTAERPADVATHLAAAAATVGLAWAEVELDGSPAARHGAASGEPATVVPVAHGGTTFGQLRCQPHAGRTLDADDSALLAALASQAGLAVSHARLASRIVHAHESERRRIERNLHDGAQQELVGLVAQLGLVRSRMNGDPATRETLSALHDEVKQILSNLRDLAQGIHPSVLTDGGIVAAVEDRCSRLPIEVSLQVSPSMRGHRFGDDVEGAAYFFVAEALTNVLKHARSPSVQVRLRFHRSQLTAQVTDLGVGFDPARASRRGLDGLADRLRALGGTLRVHSTPGHGTRVTATLQAEPVQEGST